MRRSRRWLTASNAWSTSPPRCSRRVARSRLDELSDRVEPRYPDELPSRRRQFERDKETLRELGIPIRIETVDGFGSEQAYRIHPDDYYLPELELTEAELAALHVAVTAVRLEGDAGREGLAKLGGVWRCRGRRGAQQRQPAGAGVRRSLAAPRPAAASRPSDRRTRSPPASSVSGLNVERVSSVRGGQIVIGWLDGLVGALPGGLNLYQALRRPRGAERADSAAAAGRLDRRRGRAAAGGRRRRGRVRSRCDAREPSTSRRAVPERRGSPKVVVVMPARAGGRDAGADGRGDPAWTSSTR